MLQLNQLSKSYHYLNSTLIHFKLIYLTFVLYIVNTKMHKMTLLELIK